MTGSFGNWPRFIKQAFEYTPPQLDFYRIPISIIINLSIHTNFRYRNLNPGGYFEIQDISFPIRSLPSSPLPLDSALLKWATLMLEASVNLGCPLDTADSCKRLLEEAGFEDVVEKEYKWPMNRWPQDKKLREIGEFSILEGWKFRRRHD